MDLRSLSFLENVEEVKRRLAELEEQRKSKEENLKEKIEEVGKIQEEIAALKVLLVFLFEVRQKKQSYYKKENVCEQSLRIREGVSLTSLPVILL